MSTGQSVGKASNKGTSTYVFGDGRISTHADPTRGPGDATDSSDFGLLGNLWGAKFPKMGDSLPRTPITNMQNLTPLALSSAE